MLLTAAGIGLWVYNNDQLYTHTKFVSITELNSIIPSEELVFENQVVLSPDKTKYVFLTSPDLGMRKTTLWTVNINGSNLQPRVIEESLRYITSPVWAPDSNSFAFIQIYPFELWTYNLQSNIKELIYSEKEHETDNILNPSLGYGGKTYLEWDFFNKLYFENNKPIKPEIYSLDLNTKEIAKEKLKDYSTAAADFNNIVQQSQRNPLWGSQILGACIDNTISSAGCAISALSMMINSYGTEIDPLQLNTQLKNKDNLGYLEGCDVRWNIIPNIATDLTLKSAYFNEKSFERLDYELSNGNAVIAGYNSVSFTQIPHWVVVTKKIENDYIIRDPWKIENETGLLSEFGQFDHLIVYEKLAK